MGINVKKELKEELREAAGYMWLERTIVSLVVLAFGADPLARWLYPTITDYMSWYQLAVTASVRPAMDAETVCYSEDPRVGLVGAAIWMRHPQTVADQGILFRLLAESFPPKRVISVMSLLGQLGAHHPAGDHWYMPVIAVDPIHQGQSIGGTLMTTALERVDNEGLPAFLECTDERNLKFYERFAFECVDEVSTDDSPVIYPMVRKAKPPMCELAKEMIDDWQESKKWPEVIDG